MVVNASNREKDLVWMHAHTAGFAVTIDDETMDTALIAVQGPKAFALLAHFTAHDLLAVPRFGVTVTMLAGVQAMLARTGYTGEDGMEIFCPASQAEELWDKLCALGGIPCGLGARDTLRVEAALPLYGHEMDAHTTPYAARLAWVVKTDKQSDFLGKAALSEIKAAPRGKVLVGLEMEGRAIPREGYPVMAGDTAIGHVTSGTFSPMRNKGVAMARVPAAHSAKGTTLDVVIREVRHAAKIVSPALL